MNKYADIINLAKPQLKYHQPMSNENRAAQFAPFAALNGYEGLINEEGRQTNSKIDLDEYEKADINSALQYLIQNPNTYCSLTYFVKDEYKSGGTYLTIKGLIKKIDIDKHLVICNDGNTIDINDLIFLEVL